MAERIPQSVTIRVPLQAYLTSDHISAATGKTIAVTISKNGAAYGNPSGGATNATEIGSGSYYVDLSTTDTGTTGPLFVKGTEGTIDAIIGIYNVVNANNAGLAALPNAAAEAAGGLYTRGAGAGQLSQSVNGELGVVTLAKTLTTYTGNTLQTGDAYAVVNSGTFGNSALKTLIDVLGTYVDTEVAAIKAKTDNLPGSPAAVGSAMTLTSGERDSIAAALLDLASAIETGLTLRNALRLIAAATAGECSGFPTATDIYKSVDLSGTAVVGTKSRITATTDADGNRTAIIVDLT